MITKPVFSNQVFNMSHDGLVPKSTDITKYLKGDGTWATAGGQTLYDTVVASSGGDYTTVNAALTAGKTRIFVRNGTYIETVTWDLASDTTIMGESYGGVIFDFNATANAYINISSGSAGVFRERIKLENLWFKNWGTNPNNDFIYGARERRIIMKDLLFTITSGNVAIIINLGGHSTDYNSGSYLENLNFIYSGSGGYNVRCVRLLDGFRYSTLNGLTYIGSATITNKICTVLLGGGQYSSITNVHSYGSIDMAVDIRGAYYSSFSNISVELAKNTGGTGKGLVLGENINSVVNNVVLTNCDEGFRIYANLCTGMVVHGITFAGNTTDVIYGGGEYQSTIQNLIGASSIYERKVKWMKNTSGITIAQGAVVVVKSAAGGDEITTTTTGGDNKVVGVTETSIANNAYGYILISGKTKYLKVNGTTAIAIGDFLTTFTTAEIAQKAVTGNTAFAIALEAYNVADSNGVIDTLIISPRLI